MKKHNPLNIFKWTNYKFIINSIIFLTLIPFRLPINIILIKFFNNLSSLVPADLTDDLIRSNIMITKLILDILLSILFVYNIEHLSRDILGRKAQDSGCDTTLYWWSTIIIPAMVAYIIFDMVYIWDLIPLIL